MSVIIESNLYKIKIKKRVIQLLQSYRQIKQCDKESGGILVGYETINGDFVIEYYTEPYSNDRSSRVSFDRIDKKHNEILKDIWNREGNIHMYMGEWHTHPEDYPKYSNKDKKNWIEIAKKMNKRKFFHIIVGNKKISIWQCDGLTNEIKKIGDIFNE